MRTGLRFLVSVTAVFTMATVFAGVAAADPPPSAGTTTTFQVTGATLEIAVPATGDIGSAGPGQSVSGLLGAVSVTDGRAALDASWQASVVATDFTTGGGTPEETVPVGRVDYWAGPATATTGNGTFFAAQETPASADPLDDTTPVLAFTHEGGSGNNSATWNPTLVINVPADGVAGTYTGTVTHSLT